MKVLDTLYSNLGDLVKLKKEPTPLPPKDLQKKTSIKKTKGDSIESTAQQQMEKALKKLGHDNYAVNITFHKKAKMYVIKIIDTETKKVVKEAPLEKILDMISSIEDSIKYKQIKGR